MNGPVLDAWRGAPRRSDPGRLRAMVASGRLSLAPAAALAEGRLRVLGDRALAGWPGLPDAAGWVASWTAHFGFPPLRAHAPTHAVAWANPVGMDQDEALDLLAGWQPSDDPMRMRFGAALERVPVAPPTDPRGVRGWWRGRWALGDSADALAAAVAHLPASVVATLGVWVDVGGRRVLLPHGPPGTGDARPRGDLLAEPGDWRVLGLVGAAASGKTTLARDLAVALTRRRERVIVLSADDFSWPGEGFRYELVAGQRRAEIDGPGLVDDAGLAWAIRAMMDRADRVIVEGCFVGLDPRIDALLDLRVGVVRDPAARLRARAARDATRPFDVVTDTCAKVFHEEWDGIAPLLQRVSFRVPTPD